MAKGLGWGRADSRWPMLSSRGALCYGGFVLQVILILSVFSGALIGLRVLSIFQAGQFGPAEDHVLGAVASEGVAAGFDLDYAAVGGDFDCRHALFLVLNTQAQ